MKNIGEIIKAKRKEKKLSLRDFALLCDLSHTYIDCLEKGFDPRSGKPVSPTIDTLDKIANGLGMSLIELLNLAGLTQDNNQSKSKKKPNNLYIIPPHLIRLLDAAKDLPPEKIELLISVTENMDNNPSRKKFVNTKKSNKISNESWYLIEIRKGRSVYDPDFLCRLIDENIIKPTIYGDPLTQEQKKGLIKFIESHNSLLTDIEKNDSVYPENYAAHYEGKKSLDLKKEPELAALMKASDIINKMLHRYLEEEKKKKTD
ncbi:MAG: helix-turn-helix protein [Pelotomaculum sp. PtaB.Bin104]|nr:MAG: helix-turn-helix protein [Pelotomaculum sp. PtaB.Bin104]